MHTHTHTHIAHCTLHIAHCTFRNLGHELVKLGLAEVAVTDSDIVVETRDN